MKNVNYGPVFIPFFLRKTLIHNVQNLRYVCSYPPSVLISNLFLTFRASQLFPDGVSNLSHRLYTYCIHTVHVYYEQVQIEINIDGSHAIKLF